MIKSNTKYGITLGLNPAMYPMNTKFKIINKTKLVTGTGQSATMKTKMNLRIYLSGS
jgi:hypothetical protein